MKPHTERHARLPNRISSLAAGAGRRAVPLLLALALAAGPASAHHDLEGYGDHQGVVAPHAHRRGANEPHDHWHAHAYHDVRPHQHTYTHTHWHTHVLEDGTVIHHSHPHSHTYWHYGPDETEEERVTRVEEDREKAPPHEESERESGGTKFVEPENAGSAPR
jgi:hypothetical protein